MAVKRIWFPNRPSASVDELQRSQVAIGYPFVVNNPTPVVVVPDYTDYIRQYLGDRDTLNTITAAPTKAAQSNSSYLNYLRGYLNDN